MLHNQWGYLKESMPMVKISVVATEGSAPRHKHSCMVIFKQGDEILTDGSVGGGALEFRALEIGGELLNGHNDANHWHRHLEVLALGKDLRQSCGGRVVLLFELLGAFEKSAYSELLTAHDSGFILVPYKSGEDICHAGKSANDLDIYSLPIVNDVRKLYLFGAGHVGRAVAYHASVLDFSLCWIDFADGRFPNNARDLCDDIWVAEDPAERVMDCDVGGYYLVMSHSHEVDYRIVSAILGRGDFGFLGLIGSRAKGERFRRGLREDGFSDDIIGRLVSPIGLFHSGDNTPHAIGVSVVAQLLSMHEIN